MERCKTGLVLEGGAMRGMYTAGVLDVMMENGIYTDGVIGVSAGAVFGCSYKSKQIGRTIRYNTKYCRDPRYMGIGTWLKTGDLFGADFCYRELPQKLDPFDQKAFKNNPMEFYVVCTDVHTGQPVYHQCKNGDDKDTQWMRASASMPLASRIVSIDGYDLLDGGISDSIPIRQFRKMGYRKNIVILTRARDYRKKRSKAFPILKAALRNYPELVKAMNRRHMVYNKTLDYLKKLEARGEALIIQPEKAPHVKRTERDPKKLMELYAEGRRDGLKRLKEIKQFCGIA